MEKFEWQPKQLFDSRTFFAAANFKAAVGVEGGVESDWEETLGPRLKREVVVLLKSFGTHPKVDNDKNSAAILRTAVDLNCMTNLPRVSEKIPPAFIMARRISAHNGLNLPQVTIFLVGLWNVAKF